MRVLYLAPLLPATSGNGGRKAIFNHIIDLVSSDVELEAIFIDVEEEGGSLPSFPREFSHRVYGRQLPKAAQGLRGKASGLFQAVFGRLPRSVAVVSAQRARAAIAEALRDPRLDLIIVDHLNAYGLVRGLPRQARLMYVAHNVEAEVLRHQINEMSFSVTKLLRKLDYVKMVRLEDELLRQSDRIVVIGSGDLALEPIKRYIPKVSIWPELPDEKPTKWRNLSSRKILFVGSPGYFPNKDAIDWLIGTLMPQIYEIDPRITLHLAGADGAAFGPASRYPNVVFEGFVSDDKLRELHEQADLFVCPVVLGAGIKIKVLEAASYGTPVAATTESLKGIDFLLDAAFTFSRTESSIGRRIVDLLNDSSRLAAVSSKSLDGLRQARMQRGALVNC